MRFLCNPYHTLFACEKHLLIAVSKEKSFPSEKTLLTSSIATTMFLGERTCSWMLFFLLLLEDAQAEVSWHIIHVREQEAG